MAIYSNKAINYYIVFLFISILFLNEHFSLLLAEQPVQIISTHSMSIPSTTVTSRRYRISIIFLSNWLYDDSTYPDNSYRPRILDIINPDQYLDINATAHIAIYAENLTVNGVTPELYVLRNVNFSI
jgi:hypothetical protein